ncbi:MAG: TIGR03960 family B12-binding radical SAM protein [Lachnospiraceae bacterium]|nr:TIGR03960 family B12-binding radical SAM protein [Lachnospiraceae bacterium]
MSKRALPDKILMQVDKSARYIGNELNSVIKDPSEVDVRFAICFPDVYEIGMSHLGIQILYDMFNRRDDVYCERVYSPWTDLDALMREKDIPLFALESQDEVRKFDFLGITLQYEMSYTNCLQILDLSKIPLLANERDESFPLVIGGGPCAYNPEPLAMFFDMFYIGEGEVVYDRLFDLYKEHKHKGYHKKEFLLDAANIPGIYVPELYSVNYNNNGTVNSFFPKHDGIPFKIRKQVLTDMNSASYPVKPVIPYIQAIQDRMTLEILRGCIRGCRFCQAGMIYRPLRERNPEILKEYAKEMFRSTGHEEISLSSLSSSDYTCLKEVVYFLIDEFQGKGVNISLPSLRIDNFSLDVMSKIQDIKKGSITFAPEAGTQRLRNVINKGLTEDDIIGGATECFKGGWSKIKLYFMLGLPTETEDDMKGIPILANELAKAYYDTVPKEERTGKCQITISTSFFVPKPFTPFQWAVMYKPEEYLRRAGIVNDTMKEQLNRKSMKYNWHEAYTSVLEGVLARGDRKVGQAILNAYKSGCMFDSWTDSFDFSKWEKAFSDAGLDMDFYTTREREEGEVFPWDFIDIGVTREFLLKEWHKAMKEEVTPNCRQKCSGCGAAVYKGGVCLEDKG